MSAVLALSTTSIAQAAQNAVAHPSLIEVFTTADLPITGEAISRQPGYPEIKLQTYALDGIQQFEANLSQNLTADPEPVFVNEVVASNDHTALRFFPFSA